MMDFIITKRSSGKVSQQHSFAQDFLLIMPELKKNYWKLLNEFQIQVYQESVEARPFDNYQKAWEYYTGEL